MKRLFFIFFTFISYNIFAQLQVQQVNANSAVQDILVGGGVSISNVQYSGAGAALGKFTTGNNQTNLGFSEGIIMSTGRAVEAANNVSFFASTDNGAGSDPQLAGLVTQNIRDACVLTFNFIPESDTVMFRYVFASESILILQTQTIMMFLVSLSLVPIQMAAIIAVIILHVFHKYSCFRQQCE